MALDGYTPSDAPPPGLDPNCVWCWDEHNTWIARAIADLAVQEGRDYDHISARMKWDRPQKPCTCRYHQALDAAPNGETTRLSAVRLPKPVQIPPPKVAPVPEPEPEVQAAALPEWLQPAVKKPPSGVTDSLVLWKHSGYLGPQSKQDTPKPVAPTWLNTSEVSHPLFAAPTAQMAIHQELDLAQEDPGWVSPKLKRDARQSYNLMLPPGMREQPAPLPLAEQPQGTGALPQLPKGETQPTQPAKLSSGEFPSLNAALLRIARGEAQLSSMVQPFCAEAATWAHEVTTHARALADDAKMAREMGLPHEQEFAWQEMAAALEWMAENGARVERYCQHLSRLEARHAS